MLCYSLWYINKYIFNGVYTKEVFELVAGHEFGHTLGIGDMYNNKYLSKEVKNNTKSLMNVHTEVTGAQEIDYAIMLRAQEEALFQEWHSTDNLKLLKSKENIK